MDLQKLLKEKAAYFQSAEEDRGITSVLSHIEIAERHYDNGKNGDEYLFNDTIYRSNQAFEGSLKEAYRILAEKSDQNITPYKIEKYLEDNKILQERVLQQFSNYRSQWRNVSTHDYTVYFTEQEAFLAIVNISAFINILLDQMIEKRAYEKEKEIINNLPNEVISMPTSATLVEKIMNVLNGYSKTIPSLIKGSTLPHVTESELLGSISAYFAESNLDINVKREVVIQTNDKKIRMYADFILESKNETIIMEIKKYPATHAFNLEKGIDQLLAYMTNSKINVGILFIPPLETNLLMRSEQFTRNIDNINYTIYKYYPDKNLTTASTL